MGRPTAPGNQVEDGERRRWVGSCRSTDLLGQHKAVIKIGDAGCGLADQRGRPRGVNGRRRLPRASPRACRAPERDHQSSDAVSPPDPFIPSSTSRTTVGISGRFHARRRTRGPDHDIVREFFPRSIDLSSFTDDDLGSKIEFVMNKKQAVTLSTYATNQNLRTTSIRPSFSAGVFGTARRTTRPSPVRD
jgi:hypothetical protein